LAAAAAAAASARQFRTPPLTSHSKAPRAEKQTTDTTDTANDEAMETPPSTPPHPPAPSPSGMDLPPSSSHLLASSSTPGVEGARVAASAVAPSTPVHGTVAIDRTPCRGPSSFDHSRDCDDVDGDNIDDDYIDDDVYREDYYSTPNRECAGGGSTAARSRTAGQQGRQRGHFYHAHHRRVPSSDLTPVIRNSYVEYVVPPPPPPRDANASSSTSGGGVMLLPPSAGGETDGTSGTTGLLGGTLRQRRGRMPLPRSHPPHAAPPPVPRGGGGGTTMVATIVVPRCHRGQLRCWARGESGVSWGAGGGITFGRSPNDNQPPRHDDASS
jgi:hypothetical protein